MLPEAIMKKKLLIMIITAIAVLSLTGICAAAGVFGPLDFGDFGGGGDYGGGGGGADYGGGDYGKSICLAVSQGFDTDCNGATVGSVLGVMLGYDKLPHEQWTDIIHDTLYTTLLAQDKVSIRESAKKCMEFIGPVK